MVDRGDGVGSVVVGDRATGEPIYRCGQCPPCRAGRYNVCRQIGFHGLMADGGMAAWRSSLSEFTIGRAIALRLAADGADIAEKLGGHLGLGKGQALEQYAAGIPLGRGQIPEEVAAFVSYMAGPDSAYMTGQSVVIDGGLVMR